MYSKFLTLNINDFTRAGIMFVLSSVIQGTVTMLTNHTFNLKEMASVALIAALTYLGKNLATNSNGKFLRGDPHP